LVGDAHGRAPRLAVTLRSCDSEGESVIWAARVTVRVCCPFVNALLPSEGRAPAADERLPLAAGVDGDERDRDRARGNPPDEEDDRLRTVADRQALLTCETVGTVNHVDTRVVWDGGAQREQAIARRGWQV